MIFRISWWENDFKEAFMIKYMIQWFQCILNCDHSTYGQKVIILSFAHQYCEWTWELESRFVSCANVHYKKFFWKYMLWCTIEAFVSLLNHPYKDFMAIIILCCAYVQIQRALYKLMLWKFWTVSDS